MDSFLTPYAITAIALSGTSCVAMVLSRLRSATGALIWWLLSLLWTLLLVFFFTQAGIYALSGIAATCGIAGLVLSLLQSLTFQQDRRSGSTRPLWSGCFLLLLALCALVPETAPHDTFMMRYIFAIIFFLSRPLSIGCSCFAIAGALDCLGRGNDERVSHISKDMVFLASTLFLAGEIAGSYWSFVGWGTTWRWSGNFYFSAMIFVLYMVALHIPRALFTTHRTYLTAFVLPLGCIVFSLVLSKLL